jgi:hypothetical protein
LAQNPFADDIRRGKTLEALGSRDWTGARDKLDAGQKQLEAWNDFDWENAVEQKLRQRSATICSSPPNSAGSRESSSSSWRQRGDWAQRNR